MLMFATLQALAGNSCFEEAIRLFPENQATILCSGDPSRVDVGPVQCARDRRTKRMRPDIVVQLCEGANDTSPVDCFTKCQKAHRGLLDSDAVELCSRSESNSAEICIKATAKKFKLTNSQIVHLCKGTNGIAAAECLQSSNKLKIDKASKVELCAISVNAHSTDLSIR
jgi:hypothetical protein